MHVRTIIFPYINAERNMKKKILVITGISVKWEFKIDARENFDCQEIQGKETQCDLKEKENMLK